MGCFKLGIFATGVVILANSITWIVSNIGVDLVRDLAMSFLVVVIWALVSVAFLFLLATVSVYECSFKGFGFSSVQPVLPIWKAKTAVIWSLRIDLELVHKFRPYWAGRVAQSSSFALALECLEEFRHQEYETDERRRREALKLVHNAGVEGTDHGRQLDQREFKETIDALDWLWTCHVGNYRRGKQYRQDMLEIVALGGFKNLPLDHGVVMKIAGDGQSWYASRRTITGWCLAIGASGPPITKVYYDGPEEPISWPGSAGWDAVPGGKYSPNWGL